MPIPSGHAVWSAISQLANPSFVTNRLGEDKYDKALNLMEAKTPQGHRRDLLVCNSKTVRSSIIRHILASQQDSPKHSYTIVRDERIDNWDRFMPIISARHSRPVIAENTDYRTTAHAAITPTLLQAFKMMNPLYREELEITDTSESGVKRDLFSQFVGNGYATLASHIGINGNGGFKSAMKLEKRDMLVTAAMVSGIHCYAETYVEHYEAEAPTTSEERVAKEVRRRYQADLQELWSDKLHSFHISVKGGFKGKGLKNFLHIIKKL